MASSTNITQASDLEKLYRAVNAIFEEMGVTTRYEKHLTGRNKAGFTLVLVVEDVRYQIYLSLRNEKCGIRRVEDGQTHPGPDLADPQFFEKVLERLHPNFPGPRQ